MAKSLPKGHRSCLDPAFRYYPAASTHIQRTFARIRREMAQEAKNAEEVAQKVRPLAAKEAKK